MAAIFVNSERLSTSTLTEGIPKFLDYRCKMFAKDTLCFLFQGHSGPKDTITCPKVVHSKDEIEAQQIKSPSCCSLSTNTVWLCISACGTWLARDTDPLTYVYRCKLTLSHTLYVVAWFILLSLGDSKEVEKHILVSKIYILNSLLLLLVPSWL